MPRGSLLWAACSSSPVHTIAAGDRWEIHGQESGRKRNLSGLPDAVFRFSVNLKGYRAMPEQVFVKWKQKVLLGASLRIVAPTDQYDVTKLINWEPTDGPSPTPSG